ncbi:ADP-ribose diphosphatase [Bisgaardia hudsonensis]|uniref:ADP-ribose diphosphatase n=1 Tax=Bisgaardia hudsonensis TaxID=109472 RepID=A0A4R2MX63_9PAST|nr:ADP compounds hydrolase NudE [Bisgaardia hudsonensis]QLB13704.1 ADP compounds hydrolase NudE [Bisgaardia hudsonensis]TCP12039.1 ADP-ribose diphosphatase [Bisgaardia hudsonensis]
MNILQKPEILSISTVSKSRIFEIQSIELKFSNGEYRVYERIKPSSRAAVMILAIDGDDLLMIKEYAVGTERYELGFPKGLMDPNETPEESANRELKEEIGLGANSLTHLRTINSSPSFMNNPMHIFIAKDFYPCKLEGDEPEPLQLIRYPLNKIDQLLADPDFYEARNLTALYLLKDYLSIKS